MFWADAENAIIVWQMARAYKKGRYYEDWIDRLVVMGVIEEEDYHRENGRVFNIPRCCVEWFIYLKCYLDCEDPLIMTDNTYSDDEMQDYYNYVRCPNCRKGR